MLGVPVQYFGLIFLTSVVGYMGGSGLSARLSRHHESERVMFRGVMVATLASGLMLAGGALWPQSVSALMLPMMVYSVAMGLVLPHAMAIALRPFAHIAGTASSLLGFIQMSLAAGASALTGVFVIDTPLPMVWTMLAISATALLIVVRVPGFAARTKP
jgi:DHA1 family bicyclomycin/chloramphenicol resistance-like MFS transporter